MKRDQRRLTLSRTTLRDLTATGGDVLIRVPTGGQPTDACNTVSGHGGCNSGGGGGGAYTYGPSGCGPACATN